MQKQNIKTMRQISKLLGFVCLLSLAACGSERVYTTASYASLKSYTAKQHYIDTKTTKTYVQGDISFGKHMQEAGDFDDTKTIASINAHRTTTGNFYNFYYGLGASFGNYKFKEGFDSLIDDGEKQSFYNINLKTGANITYTRPKIDYRFLGLELTYHNEFGPYQDPDKHKVLSIDNSMFVKDRSKDFKSLCNINDVSIDRVYGAIEEWMEK